MTSRASAKRAGSETEHWGVDHARGWGFQAEKIALAGAIDEGDFWIRWRHGFVVVQSKRRRNLAVDSTIRAAEGQARAYSETRALDPPASGVLLWRPYGLGRARIGEWTVAMGYNTFLDTLNRAGLEVLSIPEGRTPVSGSRMTGRRTTRRNA